MIKMNWMSLKIHLGCEVREFQVQQKKWGPDTIIISKVLLAITYERQMYKNLFCENCIKW